MAILTDEKNLQLETFGLIVRRVFFFTIVLNSFVLSVVVFGGSPEIAIEIAKGSVLVWMALTATLTHVEIKLDSQRSLSDVLGVPYIVLKAYCLLFGLAIFGHIAFTSDLVYLNPKLSQWFVPTAPFWNILVVYLIFAGEVGPIWFYTFLNHKLINEPSTPRKVRIHLQNFFYFLGIPLSTASLSFIIVSLLFLFPMKLDERHLEQFGMLVGGAGAFLLFINSALATCLDTHAEKKLYRQVTDNGWPNWIVAAVFIAFAAVIPLFSEPWKPIGLGLIVVGIVQVMHALKASAWKSYLWSIGDGLAGVIMGWLIVLTQSQHIFYLGFLLFIVLVLRLKLTIECNHAFVQVTMSGCPPLIALLLGCGRIALPISLFVLISIFLSFLSAYKGNLVEPPFLVTLVVVDMLLQALWWLALPSLGEAT